LYGLYPSDCVNKDLLNLKPAMTFKTYISHIKTLEEGAGVCYGRKFITTRRSKIDTLPLGYADGFSRLLSGRARVLVKGKRVSVVGNICMDQLMIDVTDVEDIDLDAEVILFGYGHNHPRVEELAEELGTINYEILCMVSKRVPRIYL